MIVASLMLSAIVFVSTFDTPTPGTQPARRVLQQQADDALAILYDTPIRGSSQGDNALSVYLAQCMQGNCTNMTRKLDNILPVGASYAIYVSNGFETFPVLATREPRGEAVTSTQLLEPKWSNVFVGTAMNNTNPASDPLTIYALPIFNSNVLSQGGSPLRVLVHGTRLADGSNYTLLGYASTQAFAKNDPLAMALSLTWMNATYDGPTLTKLTPTGFVDETAKTLNITGLPSYRPVNLTLRLNETGNVPLQAGAEVTVQFPRGWIGDVNLTLGTADPDWTLIANATDNSSSYAASDVVVRLKREVRSGYVDLRLNATYLGDKLNEYPFHARVTKGATAEAALLVKADTKANATQTFAVPSVYLSVPRPMGDDDNTTWTLAVHVPTSQDETNGTRRGVSIHSIEILEQDNALVFGGIEGIHGSKGAWVNLQDRLKWTGEHNSTVGPLNLVFNVTASGKAGSDKPKTTFTPPASLDDFKGRLVQQTSPGLYRGSFLPSEAKYGGYDPNFGLGSALHPVRTDALYRSTMLSGGWNYTANTLSPYHDALWGSYVNVEKRTVPLGQDVVLTADVQSVLFELAQAGQQAGVKLRFYPPWSGDAHVPIWEQSNLDSGFLTSDVTQMMLLDINGDGYEDPVIGTSNGRVLALHAVTGARLQGNVFNASVAAGAPPGTLSKITHLAPIRLYGQDYIVVGTDKQSGIYVIDKMFNRIWSFDKTGWDTISLSTTTDFDSDGQPDIVVGANQVTLSGAKSIIYVLKAQQGQPTLVPYLPYTATAVPNGFFEPVGPPTGLLAMPKIGATATNPGFAVSMQTLPEAGAETSNQNSLLPTIEGFYVKVPKAGFQGVDYRGNLSFTFHGTPISVVRPYDYDDGFGATDLIAGGSAGFVVQINGTSGSIPLSNYIWAESRMVTAADALDAHRAWIVTADGNLWFTTDGFETRTCGACTFDELYLQYPPAVHLGVTGLSMNGTLSFWMVGGVNGIWQSVHLKDSGLQPAINTRDALPAVATKVRVASPPVPTVYDFGQRSHVMNDVETGWSALNRDVAIVVGGPCVVCNGGPGIPDDTNEPLVMRTSDGGLTWSLLSFAGGTLNATDATGGPVMASGELTKVNFTTEQIGWIVGKQGNLFRTMNGGITFMGLRSPHPGELSDIACDPVNPNYCMLVSPDGVAFVSFDALGPDPIWLPMDVGVEASTRPLHSVGIIDGQRAIIGSHNMILRTYSGGYSWTTTPMNYIEGTGTMVHAFPDGTGFIQGGNATQARTWMIHDHPGTSRVQTVKLTDPIAYGRPIKKVDVTIEHGLQNYDNGDDPFFRVSATTNGTNYLQMTRVTGPSFFFQTIDGDQVPAFRSTYSVWVPTAMRSDDLRIRVDLASPDGETSLTPWLNAITVKATYTTVAGADATFTVTPSTSSNAQIDLAASTGVWGHGTLKALHHPLAEEGWVRNVSGEVLDIVTMDYRGSSKAEVWVATGSVLSGNSPDHVIYAGSDRNKYVKPDNRIYLLEGESGVVLAQTASHAGKITHIRVSEKNGQPDILYAIEWDAALKQGRLHMYHPETLQHLHSQELGPNQPSDLEQGQAPSPRANAPTSTAYTATLLTDPTDPKPVTGRVHAIQGHFNHTIWTSIPDDRGRYIVTKTIPQEWLFGPYVVEIEVDWTDNVGVGGGTQVLQSARFFDYFIVNPPASLSPPSPVYTVHLVAWFDDWR